MVAGGDLLRPARRNFTAAAPLPLEPEGLFSTRAAREREGPARVPQRSSTAAGQPSLTCIRLRPRAADQRVTL